MEEYLRSLFADKVTLAWMFLIISFCWFAYIPGRL
ncbi:hypothetical protein STA3757_13480 [Stanieria sp. NIES-3757]|nr:hypothetical protein STA3757_13480 [Stanieria sp. NIES-3757]